MSLKTNRCYRIGSLKSGTARTISAKHISNLSVPQLHNLLKRPRYDALSRFPRAFIGVENREELALGHATYGVAGHYGEWVRSQVSEETFENYSRATRLSERGFGGEAYDWEIPLKYHNSIWTADRTIDFLSNRDTSQPFLLAVGFQIRIIRTVFRLRLKIVLIPHKSPLPDFVEGELADKPPHFLEARCGQLEQSKIRGTFAIAGQGGGADYRKVSESDARLGRAYYYNMVKIIDQQMGRILECLETGGLAENTLVVFTTDHGELIGDHGLWMKGPFHYEQLIRIPMLLRFPQAIPTGQRTQALFSHVDIVPTVLSCSRFAHPVGYRRRRCDANAYG